MNIFIYTANVTVSVYLYLLLLLPALWSDVHRLEIQLYHMHRWVVLWCALLAANCHRANHFRCPVSFDGFDVTDRNSICKTTTRRKKQPRVNEVMNSFMRKM